MWERKSRCSWSLRRPDLIARTAKRRILEIPQEHRHRLQLLRAFSLDHLLRSPIATSRHSDFCHFDNIGINAVSYWLEPTIVPAEARLLSRLTLRAPMAINALWIITLESKSARSHPSNGSENVQFLLCQFAIMVVITIILVWAFTEQEMIIAQLELLQPIKILARDALEVESIHTLSVFIALYRLRWDGQSTWFQSHHLLKIRRTVMLGWS